MKTIAVHTAKEYNVIVGTGILNQFHSYLPSALYRSAVIISDENVWPLYGMQTQLTLINSGLDVKHYIIPAGESSKNAETYLSIINYLAQIQFTRSDLLIALGGGVVGDLTGFVAATYLRGVSYIQIPTTLLAMVDASVGGKTAINLPSGKNLVGAFYQPDLVMCDIAVLDSLEPSVFRDGCAEIIKYGILYDPILFSHLEKNIFDFDREYVIARCIELKNQVVSKDTFDVGIRQQLNLGHTIGHGVETFSEFRITHGHAVAIGINIISKAAANMGICSSETYQRIHNLLKGFNFDLTVDACAGELFSAALSDKKRLGNTVNLIVPQAVGMCCIRQTLVEELQSIIEAGL